jgi:hypothetical protein
MDPLGIRTIRLPVFLVVATTAASLVSTSIGPNLFRKLTSNAEGRSTLSQFALDDSPSAEEMPGIFKHFTFSERLNILIPGSSQTNLKESMLESTTPLEGYLIVATYSGSACASEVIAISSPLNSCTKYTAAGITEYMKLTATESYSLKTFYSDQECRTVTATESPNSYVSGCNSGSLVYVSLDGIPPSSSAMASLRFVVTRMVFSSSFPPPIILPLSPLLTIHRNAT